VLAASVGLLVVTGVVLAALVLAVHDLSAAGERAQRGREASAIANRLERLVVDAETGVRGFIISGDEDLLRPYRAAQTRIPHTYNELVEAISDPVQREVASGIGGSVLTYLDVWAGTLVAAVREGGLDAGRRLVATSEGRSRLDIIRSRFEQFAARQGALQRDRDAAAAAGARRAELLAYGGFGLLALVIVLAVVYVSRRVTRPVQALAAMARRIQDGDLGARSPVDGAAELGRLQERLNDMAAELGAAVRRLEDGNAQLKAHVAERERLVREVEERERRYRTLAQVGRRLAAETELEATGGVLVEALAEALGADAAWLHALGADGGALRLVAAHGIDPGALAPRLLASGPEAAGACAEEGPYRTEAVADGRPLLRLPLTSGRRLVGLVSLAVGPDRGTEQEDLAPGLMDQAAIAVGNALSFERARALAATTEAVVETGSDAFISMDAEGLICDWNARAEAMLGHPRGEARGRSLARLIVPERLREAHREGFATFLATGRWSLLDGPVEMPALRRDGVELPVEVCASATYLPEGPRLNLFVRDISERRAAEEALRASEATQRSVAQEQAGLRRVAQAIAGKDDPAEIFDLVAREAGALLDADCGLVARFGDARAIVVGWFAHGRPVPTRGLALDGPGALAGVSRSGRSIRVGDYAALDRDGVVETALRSGYRSSVAAPVRVGGRVWGAILIASSRAGAFSVEDERRAAEFAQLLSLAAVGAEGREAERAAEAAREQFLAPAAPGPQTAARSRPAGS
jgi:PAS domain S-box-containing protein